MHFTYSYLYYWHSYIHIQHENIRNRYRYVKFMSRLATQQALLQIGMGLPSQMSLFKRCRLNKWKLKIDRKLKRNGVDLHSSTTLTMRIMRWDDYEELWCHNIYTLVYIELLFIHRKICIHCHHEHCIWSGAGQTVVPVWWCCPETPAGWASR